MSIKIVMFLSDLHQSGRLGAYPSEILEFYFGTGFVKIKFQDFLGLDWALKLLLNSYFNMTFNLSEKLGEAGVHSTSPLFDSSFNFSLINPGSVINIFIFPRCDLHQSGRLRGAVFSCCSTWGHLGNFHLGNNDAATFNGLKPYTPCKP